MTERTTPAVQFWFDPICPWTWITSRWVSEVANLRDFEVQWHPFSLAVLNEGVDAGDHAEGQRQGHRMGRVLTAVSEAHGGRAVAELYTALGNRLHPAGRDDVDVIIAESLDEVGLPAALAAAADSGEHEAELVASTQRGIDLVGPGVGIPIIAIDGVAFFGPVVSPAPTGDDALKLWDGVHAAASISGFYELKRGRGVGPQFNSSPRP
ncbi:mycothiol-dependent nitroreductase Rv2466c family protein [Leucobacter sp. W1478]|uniref:mycothiol-dependent nitroreductase Rv2466c family protein n=1 Tax=Leucobacter sp. W1478 TaxID=3439065 RepID=UPI003F3EC0D8